MMSTTHSPFNINQASQPSVTTDWATLRRTFQRFTTPMGAVHILRSCVPELSTGAFEISTCVILDARLKTYLKPTSKRKSTLSAGYHLTLRERSTGQTAQRIFYAKVFLDGLSMEAVRLLPSSGLSDVEFRYAVTHVPEHDLILWRFPHDPTLPHLRHLVDLVAIEQHLPLEGLKQIGLQGAPQVLTRDLVKYRPEIRCTNRYDLYDSTLDRTSQLFGKTFGDADGQALYERLQFFWDRSLTDPEAMAIAQPLGYSHAINTVWQHGVSGTPLLQVLDTSNYTHYIAAIAKGLASLHTSQVVALATHSPDGHLIEMRKKLTKLSDALPHHSEMFSVIGEDITRTAPLPNAIPFRPIHWDFHIDQLLADQGILTFCDLDELIIGDPLQDLANFIVDLHVRLADQEFVRLLTTELCHHYQKLVTWEVSAERLAWHIRLQLVNKAYRQYLRFAPGFEDMVESMMRLAQRGLPV
jgi:aminoglycoside phosphotransferase (APT) family kinase protein